MKTPVRVATAFGLLAAAMLLGCRDAAEQHNAVRSKPRPTQVEPMRPLAPADVDVARPAPQPEFAPVQPPAQRLMGYTPRPRESEAFYRSLPQPFLQQAAPHLFRARGPPTALKQTATDSKPVLLYRALLTAYRQKYGKEFVVGAQAIGDCTSWGWAHGINVSLAIDYLSGASGDFAMVATEATYGLGRVEGAGLTYNRSGDGSYGAAMAKGATRFGVLFRKDYSSLGRPEYDLRVYSGAKARDWGANGCGGRYDQGRLDAEAKKHRLGQVAIVDSFAALKAALKNGYTVAVCSGQGFNSTRDAEGFLQPWGSWPHCMCFDGYRDDHRPGAHCMNSWGPGWVGGPKWPTVVVQFNRATGGIFFPRAGGDGAQLDPLFPVVPNYELQLITGPKGDVASDMPDGSFWVDAAVVDRMLRGRDSYAISNLVGFPRRELHLIKGL
jgi:hypothetical protein